MSSSDAPTILILCGPSGAGKSTIKDRLTHDFPAKFGFSVSYTTRQPREKMVEGVRTMEEDGVDYFFVSPDRFDALIDQGEFVEHATFGRNKYGTALSYIAQIEAAGQISLLDIEMEGVKQVHASAVRTLTLFVVPPSLDVLERRLRGRGTDSESAILQRLEKARIELEFADISSREGAGELIVNDNLDLAYAQVRQRCLDAFPSLRPSDSAAADEKQERILATATTATTAAAAAPVPALP